MAKKAIAGVRFYPASPLRHRIERSKKHEIYNQSYKADQEWLCKVQQIRQSEKQKQQGKTP